MVLFKVVNEMAQAVDSMSIAECGVFVSGTLAPHVEVMIILCVIVYNKTPLSMGTSFVSLVKNCIPPFPSMWCGVLVFSSLALSRACTRPTLKV